VPVMASRHPGGRARWVAMGSLLLLALAWPSPVRADGGTMLCRMLLQCYWESPPFTIRVIDKDTGRPLVDVHGLAVWMIYSVGSATQAVFMQDAVSGPDGVLRFAGWGPLRGYQELERPFITLFKPGYVLPRPEPGMRRTIRGHIPDGEFDTGIRRFSRDGETFAMVPFQGSPAEWLGELKEALELGGNFDPARPEPARTPFLNRLYRVRAEVQRLVDQKISGPDVSAYLSRLESEIRWVERRGIR
jgi:hypothetical protein